MNAVADLQQNGTILNANSPFVFALDIGTSSVRAQIYDARARPVENFFARVTYSFRTTAEGGAERDTDELLADVMTVLSGVCAKANGRINRIDRIAVSCFWHSLVGVDAR
jgi:gluconokinase